MDTAVGVVAFAFGVPYTILSNKQIALIAAREAQKFDTSVYTQFAVCIERGIEVEYTHEEHGNPPPTLRIARRAVQWAKRKKFKELWVVAAKPHLPRALRDIKRAIREAEARIEVFVCKEVEKYPEDSWFCLDSTQKRTRTRKAWALREKILMWMPFWIYNRIAS